MIELDFENLSQDQQALELFAQAIASGIPPEKHINCWNWCTKQTIPFLASRVEHLSGGKLTVREAAKFLFSLEVMGGCFYLASCSIDTPEGEVTELANDTVLMMLTGSLTFPVKPASAEAIAQGQQLKIEHDNWHRDRKLITETAELQAKAIIRALSARIAAQTTDQNTWTSNALRSQLAGGSLANAMFVCVRLDINFDEVVREALST